jgi:hypothetical protein
LKLRLLELPLSSAKTADEAAQALIKLFAATSERISAIIRKGKMLRPKHYANDVAAEWYAVFKTAPSCLPSQAP